MSLMIKQLRKNLHISQTEFSELVGVSLRTVGSWERGESVPNAEQIWNCAVILHCTPNDVLGWSEGHPKHDYEMKLNSAEKTIIDCYRNSTPQWQMYISRSARAASDESEIEKETI